MKIFNTLTLSVLFAGFLFTNAVQAQDEDLLSLLGDEEEETELVNASFKTNRVINAHSLENTAKGVLDFKISHRFGFLSGSFYELFGLDNASMRMGFDYGVTDRLQIGIGRSSYEKMFDGYIKYKLLWQSTGKKKMPLSLSLYSSIAITTLKWANPDRTNFFSSRLSYCHQIIFGRKFSEGFTLQMMPTLVHRNLVKTSDEKNDVFSIGVAGRVKLTKRMSINAEYFYVLPNQLADGYRNSLSLGLDLETGGHVFQLHFTNSTSMVDKGVIGETIGDWFKGQIHFGFNVSRVFTVVKPKAFKKGSSE